MGSEGGVLESAECEACAVGVGYGSLMGENGSGTPKPSLKMVKGEVEEEELERTHDIEGDTNCNDVMTHDKTS